MGLRPIMENKNTQLKNYHNVHKRYIFNLSERINKDYIGNKALNLRFLEKKGFNIPKTFVLGYEAFNAYSKGERVR